MPEASDHLSRNESVYDGHQSQFQGLTIGGDDKGSPKIHHPRPQHPAKVQEDWEMFDRQQQEQSVRNWHRPAPKNSSAGRDSLYGETPGGSVYGSTYEGSNASNSGYLPPTGRYQGRMAPEAPKYAAYNELQQVHHPRVQRPRPDLNESLTKLSHLDDCQRFAPANPSVESDSLYGGTRHGNASTRRHSEPSPGGSSVNPSLFSFSKEPIPAGFNNHPQRHAESRAQTPHPPTTSGIRVSECSRNLDRHIRKHAERGTRN
jgi:hypothetical protein